MKRNKEQLRQEASRLLKCENQYDSIDLIDIYLKFLFMIVRDHQMEKVNSQEKAEARMINQMMFAKVAVLKDTLKGIEFCYENTHLNNITDPTIIASFIRNIYETVALFNLIYIYPKNENEKKILYNLWVHSGLKYRQRFKNVAKSAVSIEKLESEKQEIENLKSEIRNTELYKSLDKRNKNKIETKIKEKDYKIRFQQENVEFLSWQDLTKTLGIEIPFFDTIL